MGLVWESCAVTGQGGAASPGLLGHSVQRGSSSGVICIFFFLSISAPKLQCLIIGTLVMKATLRVAGTFSSCKVHGLLGPEQQTSEVHVGIQQEK